MARSPKTRKSFNINGEWYKSSAYEIFPTGAKPIFPKDGSTLKKSDPWESFRRNEGTRLQEAQPYLRLLELGRKVREHRANELNELRSGTPSNSKPDGERDLALSWCDENGLLGILPVVADKIVCLASVEQQAIEDMHTPRYFVASQLRYARTGGLWRQASREGFLCEVRSEALAEEYEMNEEPPRVHTLGWGGEHFQYRETLACFFPLDGGPMAAKWAEERHLTEEYYPGKPARQEYVPTRSVPLPGSKEFFEVYGEPVGAITYWALAFERAVLALSGMMHDQAHAASGLSLLADLASSADPAFRFGRPGEIEEVRVSAGPLASYALMVLWDLQEGRRIHPCKKCGDYFVSRDTRAGYCTVRCRNSAQTRRHRDKKKYERSALATESNL